MRSNIQEKRMEDDGDEPCGIITLGEVQLGEAEPVPLIATAKQLRKATAAALKKREEEAHSFARLCADWMNWFEKRAPKMLKDATARGAWYISLDLPQPGRFKERLALRKLKGIVEDMLPGCSICFVEEEYEEGKQYTLEISWKEEDEADEAEGDNDGSE